MGKNNISRILDATLIRVAFDLHKNNIYHSYKDYIALEILQEHGAMAYNILSTKLNEWELLQIPLRIERLIRLQPKNEDLTPEEFLNRFRWRLEQENLASKHISTTHALCDIVADTTTATSQVLAQFGINTHSIFSLIRELGNLSEGKQSPLQLNPHSQAIEEQHSATAPLLLDKFATNLTLQARMGLIDPVIGREAEIERMVQILSRRKKNNPILIGEAGVGKSALVEGLALRIAKAQVPTAIATKQIYSLDIAALVAGTKYRGEFEERMQQLLVELHETRNIIIFIDEIHTILGAGATQGTLDVANILKPALASGHVQTIGATTLTEYRLHIEQDTALERRLQKVIIEPTSHEQTIDILHKIAPLYEEHHNVKYTHEALRACVTLTERYITDRHLPDKAIDVLDEAGAHSRLHAGEQQTEHIHPSEHAPSLIKASDIEAIITSITGIPTEHLSLSQAQRLRSLEGHLQRRVIGQEEAIKRLSSALQRSGVGLRESIRPIGVFLFVGPTGVGKTLLAKEVAKYIFDHKRGLIRFDMSEYSHSHNLSRLIGSPPGYVGYGHGGQLTEAVRRQPYAVVLFDEIEKAHSDVFNLMLQIFDEGHLSDGQGRKTDFSNTIIILTTNVGARAATNATQKVGYNTPSSRHNSTIAPIKEYRKGVESTFSPEFLNRIDDIIYFRTLTLEDAKLIISLETEALLQRTRDLGYRVEISDKAKHRLAEMGYESRYGMRALRRTLAEYIEAPLSALIIEAKVQIGDRVKIESDGADGFTLKVA